MEVIQPVAVIERKILLIRRQKIMPDSDLAAVYGVATKVGSSGNSVGKVNRYGVGRRHSGLSGICPLSIILAARRFRTSRNDDKYAFHRKA